VGAVVSFEVFLSGGARANNDRGGCLLPSRWRADGARQHSVVEVRPHLRPHPRAAALRHLGVAAALSGIPKR
jgi:hypothetical protein